MPYKPMRPCRHPGCHVLTREGWCADHKPKRAERGESAEWHGLYNTDRWRELRADQLLREPFCRECAKAGRRTYATVADHIVPHRGDTRLFHDLANLQSLCERCHNRKTAKERAERRKFGGKFGG